MVLVSLLVIALSSSIKISLISKLNLYITYQKSVNWSFFFGDDWLTCRIGLDDRFLYLHFKNNLNFKMIR